MIVELTIAALSLGVGTIAFRAVIAARAKFAAKRAPTPPAEPTPAQRSARFSVGDVILIGTDELWLAGELSIEEDSPVARLFFAPGETDQWVVELASGELAHGRATSELPDGEIADRVSLEGRHLAMHRRGRGRANARGELPPALVTSEVKFVLLRGAAAILVVIDLAPGPRLAVLGRSFSPSDADVLPGGERPPR